MTSFFVPGVPAPQGSKRYVGNGVTIESSKRVKPWRSDIRNEAEKCFWPKAGYVTVTLRFVMPRPKSHYRTGKHADQLRHDAPSLHTKRPDIDKLARAVLDAMSGIAWNDDAQVAHLCAQKVYQVDAEDDVGMYVEVITDEELPL